MTTTPQQVRHATSQRAQAAGVAAEEVEEEVGYGDEEEEDEEEDTPGEAEKEVEAHPPKSAMKKPKKKAAFMISGQAKRGQRASSARPTQRQWRTTPTTFQHNWECAKQQCHEILGCFAAQVRHHYRHCFNKIGTLCVDQSGNPFVGEVAKVYSGGLRKSFVWAVSARLQVGLSLTIHSFKIRGDHTRAVPTAKDLLIRKYDLPNLEENQAQLPLDLVQYQRAYEERRLAREVAAATAAAAEAAAAKGHPGVDPSQPTSPVWHVCCLCCWGTLGYARSYKVGVRFCLVIGPVTR